MNKTKQAFTTQHNREQGHKDNTVEVKMLFIQNESAHDNVIKRSLHWGEEWNDWGLIQNRALIFFTEILIVHVTNIYEVL